MSLTPFPTSTHKQANQNRPAFEIKEISPPNCKWLTLDDFDLSKIPIVFAPASFQRKASRSHIYQIVESIVNNQFYDNTIRTIKLPNGKYEVIDGQHRLEALWLLHTQYGIKHYTLIMQFFKSDEARQVFRKINSGKRLSNADHLKTLDDGNHGDFFDILRDVAHHNPQKTKLSFYEILNCIRYKRTFVPKPVQLRTLEEMLESLTHDEMAHGYRLCHAIIMCHDQTMSPRLFTVALVRPLYKIGYENNYSTEQYVKALQKIMALQAIKEMLRQSFGSHFREIHSTIRKALHAKEDKR